MGQKCIIFDLDGTILDSLGFWNNLGKKYLTTQNISAPENLNRITEEMTVEESAEYFKRVFDIKKETKVIINEIYELISEQYKTKINAKSNIRQLILDEYKNGTRMCVLTTTNYDCAVNALERVGILKCFENVITGEMLGMNKRTKDIYLKTCEIMDYPIESTTVYEDALFAAKSAAEAGLNVIRVYDENWRN